MNIKVSRVYRGEIFPQKDIKLEYEHTNKNRPAWIFIKELPEDIFIISKVWKTNLRYDDVLKAMRGSLERLKTDYVDLYLIHWPSEEIPLDETMRAMERLAGEGLAEGVSPVHKTKLLKHSL